MTFSLTHPKLSAEQEAVLDGKIAATTALLQRIAAEFSPATLANSLGAEDMVLTDLIARLGLGIEVFMLDTGRLNNETYAVLQAATDKYDIRVQVYYPQTDAIQNWVRENGINAFYQSVDQRKACCEVRKVEPLRRALGGKKAWITGLRRAQAVTRRDLPFEEFDAGNGLVKFNPLADWSEREVWAYIRRHEVPYNALHDQGYPSIGCAPCTRALSAGEDIRAGRWWWENPETKECGLHPGAKNAVSAISSISPLKKP